MESVAGDIIHCHITYFISKNNNLLVSKFEFI